MSNDVFSAYNGAASAAIVGATTIPLDTEHLASSDTYDLASDEVTIAVAGVFEINADLSVVSTGGTRTQAQGWVERNGLEIPGTRMLFYCRQANHGASGGKQIKLALVADDVLRLRVQRTAGTGTIVAMADGCSLTLRRL